MSNDFIEIIDDIEQSEPVGNEEPQEYWVIGVIDDEPSVHQATQLALRNVSIYGRALKFVNAYNGNEGFELVKQHPDMAVVLLDVVMETEDAGLKLVERIRDELKNSSLQIVLRTGQAGYAPEEDVIINYEINSYKTKSELTRSRLFTTIAASLRSYQQLRSIEQSQNGLRAVIDASASLVLERSVFQFSIDVLAQIRTLFEAETNSLFCISQRPTNERLSLLTEEQGVFVVAADEKYKDFCGKDIQHIRTESPLLSLIKKALDQKQSVFEYDNSCLYFSTPSGWEGVIASSNSENLQLADQEIIKIFCMNVALGLENAKFFNHLNRTAFFDELTELYNRKGMIEESRAFLKANPPTYSMYLIDIDYFHHYVASLGYEFGNAILQKFAVILRQQFGEKALIARLHSDTFAVLTNSQKYSVNEIAVICSRPIVVEGQSIRLGLTVGESTSNAQHPDVTNLLRQAELALHVAKNHKRGSGETFDESYDAESQKSLMLLSDLRLAIDNKDLYLVLQPKVNITNNTVVGYEALLRWQHPRKGQIPPGAFIPTAEKAGMYYEIDLFVASALAQLFVDNPGLDTPISFNISANSLNHDSFVEDLKNIFIEKDIDFSLVEIEVTENALIQSEQAIARLRALYEFGFIICLDDFGAGFSSLNYLTRLPLNVIKIDRAFVADIVSNNESLTLLEGVIDVIKNLNKQIVVEGVETQSQLDKIKHFDVSNVQGYFFYKPLPISDAIALLP